MNDCFTLELTQYAYKLDILAFFLFDKLESFVWGAINLTAAVVKKKRIKIKDVRKGLFFYEYQSACDNPGRADLCHSLTHPQQTGDVVLRL